MTGLRFRCAALAVWIFVLHYADDFSDSVSLTPFTAPVAATLALTIVLIPRVTRIPLHWLLPVLLPVFLVIKSRLGYSLGIEDALSTSLELCILGITLVLARAVGENLLDLRNSLVTTLVGRVEERPSPFDTGQRDIHREIRRARSHQRRLTLMTVRPKHLDKVAVDRFAKQVADKISREYIAARLAQFLTAQTSDFDILVQRDGHFVILMPETGRHEADGLVQKIQAAAKLQLGLELELRSSVFPDEETTLVGLLECVETPGNGDLPDRMAVG